MIRRGTFVAVFLYLLPLSAFAQVSLTTLGTPYPQNFDSLSNTVASSTVPAGWAFVETGTNANATYSVGTGSSNAGDTWSYGAAASTERAFGALGSNNLTSVTIGAAFTNNTGATITALDIGYAGEQWRRGGRSAPNPLTDVLDFSYSLNATSLTTGTWTDVNTLDVVSPQTGTTAATLDGNNAANRVSLMQSIGSLSIPNGATFWIRWIDTNIGGNDDGLAIDDFNLTPQGSGPPPPLTISINDVTLAEGSTTATTYVFIVSLSGPAPPAGVTFDIATQDDTAFDGIGGDPDADYVPHSLTLTLFNDPFDPSSPPSISFHVLVHADLQGEGNERFFVNLSNVSGATIADGQGEGHIINDDIMRIHTIQGSGATSPLVGSGGVIVRGIVTGAKSNGFFLQEEVGDYDLNGSTSEGIFVFTGGAPGVVLGADVTVTGTVAEFVPSGDPFQPPLTELTSPVVVQNSTGNPLPPPIVLTPLFPDPAGPFDQLEIHEGMRVQVNSLTVVAPSEGSFTETNGNVSQNGRFYGVVTGVARPFREAGIRQPDPAPSGSIPPIPRWDFNPERLKVESNALGAGVLVVKTNDVIAPVVGPLDYGFRAYAILLDGTAPSIVTPGAPLVTTATPPLVNEVTVASFNLNRLFNDAADGPGPTVQTAVYQNRLGKASRAIRDHLRMPDIVGVQEVENLDTLQALAARISADAIAAAQPDPLYIAYLAEGNDPGGIDVGFLVTDREVTAGLKRLTSVAVSQEGLTFMWTDPDDGNLDELNDRPPIVLTAVVNRQPGVSTPITVLNNHLRSLLGIDSLAPDGLTTEGNRVRLKRQAQAEYLANLIQTRQTNNPNENIIVVGDFNAFEVNDGYTDVMNVIAGTPPPDNQTVVPGDGVDLVNPDLDNLVDTPPPEERYSYVHEGNAQNIDHALVNAALISGTVARRIEHPRIDADYPETDRNNPATAIRMSDHDPLVAYLAFGALSASDFGVTLTHPSGYATAGANTTYTINVANNGPDAGDATVTLPLPSGTAFFSISSGSWGCTTPIPGANGTVSCTRTGMAALTNEDIFVTVTIDGSLAASTLLTRTASVDGVNTDPVGANDSESEDVIVLQPSQYRATKTVTGPFRRGDTIAYTITIFNDKPFAQGDNGGDELTDVLPSGVTLLNATADSGTPMSSGNTVTWNGSVPSGGTVTIIISAIVDADASGLQSNQAQLADDFDDDGTNERNTLSDDPGVGGTADPTDFTVVPSNGLVTATKTATSGGFFPNAVVTYTIVLTNNMGLTLPNNFGDELTDTLPAGVNFDSASATSGSVNHVGNVVTWNGSLASGAAVTITINVRIASSATGTISNQASFVYDGDANGTNELAGVSDDPNTAAPDDPTSFTVVSAAGLVTATKIVAGTFATGSTITYTIVVTNHMQHAQPDNFSNEVTDTLPPGITFVSANASSGVTQWVPFISLLLWNGSIPSGGSVTITIVATIDNNASGTISNQAAIHFDADNSSISGDNESEAVSDDPNTAAPNDPTSFTVVPAAGLVTAAKSVSGTFVAGTNVTYTIVINNNMAHAQLDNVGDELTDLLQNGLTFVSANATSGTVVNNGGVISWNGTIPAGGSVTITMVATINSNASGTISNQATINFDTDNNGTNENTSSSTPASFNVIQPGAYTATKRIAGGTLIPGGNVVYEIALSNGLGHTLADNPGDEFTDILPPPLQLTSASATSGTAAANIGTNTVTWNGSLASGASVTITIDAAIPANASATTVANQGTAAVDLDNNATNETSVPTDDPDTPGSQPTAFTLNAITGVPVTKSVSTTGAIGAPVTYTIVITNNLPHTLTDNPGNEFIDVLQSSLILVSATATSGTAVATVATNTVTWNGSIPNGGSVTITINATVAPSASGQVANQGTANVDLDNNGTNESSTPTDDPSTAAVDDPTVFTATGLQATASIPALTPEMLIALAALLAFAALRKMTA